MKKTLSVTMLAARTMLPSLIAVIAGMALLEMALFLRIRHLHDSTDIPGYARQIRMSGSPIILAAAFLLLCGLMVLPGIDRSGSRPNYLVGRLSVRPRIASLCWALSAMLCLTVLWAAQTGVALLMGQLCLARQDPAAWSAQTLFVSFSEDGFLHGLLPLGEASRWVRNITELIGLGLSAAAMIHVHRQGGRDYALPILALAVAASFGQAVGHFSMDMTMTLLSLAICVWSIVRIVAEAPRE